MPSVWSAISQQRKFFATAYIVAVTLIIFAADFYTTLGFAHGYIYVLVILLAARLTNAKVMSIISMLALVFITVGFFVSPDSDALPMTYVIANRVLSILVVAATHLILVSLAQQARQVREKELKLAEQESFKELTDLLPVFVWTANPDGHLSYVGKQIKSGADMSPDDILDNWVDLLHPDDRERTMKVWGESVATGKDYSVEFRFRLRDSHYVWMLTRAKAKYDEQGNITTWYGSMLDISEMRQLRDNATRAAVRLQDTLESITDAFFTLNTHYEFTYLNRRAEAVLEQPVNDLLGTRITETNPSGFDAQFVEQLELAKSDMAPRHFQHFYLPLKIWLDVHVYPSSEGVAVYFRDITTQRNEQEQLKLLRTAVSRLNDIILITEAEPVSHPGPRVVFANEAFERKTGYKVSEIIGKSPRILQGPKTQSEELAKISHALKRWQSVRAKVLNYTKDGREIWLELDIVPIADETGWYTHWVAVERDVTREQTMSSQLRQVQRMDSISHLTGGIAHDFNNLLTVILGNADILEHSVDESQRPTIQRIIQAGERGAALTQSLLAFARRQALHPEPIDFGVLMNELRPLLLTALGPSCELIERIPTELPKLLADRAQLESALINFANNSRQAMTRGGEFIVEASLTELDREYIEMHPDVKPGHYLQIAISDTGSGIAKDDVDHIFEPFYSRRENGSGTGLGLSMVFGFVKQSGGHISVYTELGHGTTFRMYLPVTDIEFDKAMSKPNTLLGMPGQYTVLVVEDEPEIRKLAVQFLLTESFKVLSAENADAALRLMANNPTIDLLFTDVMMPGPLNGIELGIKFAKQYPEAPVLLTSGFAEPVVKKQASPLVDMHFPLLSKPYRKGQLINAITRLLNGQTIQD